MDVRFVVRSFCLFYVLFSECGIVQGLSGVITTFFHVCGFFFPLLLGEDGTGLVLFMSWDTLPPRYQLLCFVCFHTIFSLERDSIRKQTSLQYQSGGLIVLDLFFLFMFYHSILHGKVFLLLHIYSVLCLWFNPLYICVIYISHVILFSYTQLGL
jgi:hypothetical protein